MVNDTCMSWKRRELRRVLVLFVSFILLFEQSLVFCFASARYRCRKPYNNDADRTTRKYSFPCRPSNGNIHTSNIQSSILKSRNYNDSDNVETKELQSIPVQIINNNNILSITLVVLPILLLLLLPEKSSAMAAMTLDDNPFHFVHLDIPHVTLTGNADPRFFLAGSLCAAFSHGITTPIDVVKTKMQSDPQKFNGLGVVAASKTIVKDDGVGILIKGLGPTVVGYGLEGAAKFGLYESLKPEIAKLLNLDTPTIPFIIASVVAGGVASIILCPLERTRIRLLTDPDFSEYNLLTGIPKLVEESGVVGLFYGLPAMLSKQCPYTLGKQVTYDIFCGMLYSFVNDPNIASTKIEVSFVAACCASVVACVLSHPGDVILTETYKGKNNPSTSPSFSQTVRTIYNDRQGIKGFYSALPARLIQVGGIIVSQLLLYDFIKQSLGLPATGSS
jgi:solute carrier family 25 phosphate transporter 3